MKKKKGFIAKLSVRKTVAREISILLRMVFL